MSEEEEIRRAVTAMFERNVPLIATWLKVKSVEGKTCTVVRDEENDLTVDGILLGYDKSGNIEIPKNDTDVLVLFTDGTRTNGAVMKCEESISMELMGDEFHGIPKVEKIEEKFNNIESDINQMKGLLLQLFTPATTPIVEAGNGAVSGFQAAGLAVLNTYLTDQLQPTLKADLENQYVKHGKGNQA